MPILCVLWSGCYTLEVLPRRFSSRMPASSLCPILCLIGFDGRLQPYILRETIRDAEAGEAARLGDHQAANY